MTKKTLKSSSSNLSFEDTKIAFASKNNFQLKKSYWIFATMNQNWLVNLGTFFIKLFLFLHFPIKKVIKSTIFAQFCGGETIDGCESTIQELEKAKIGTILDYSVEGEESEKSFQKTKVSYLFNPLPLIPYHQKYLNTHLHSLIYPPLPLDMMVKI
jgi:proline dehydrogenase